MLARPLKCLVIGAVVACAGVIVGADEPAPHDPRSTPNGTIAVQLQGPIHIVRGYDGNKLTYLYAEVDAGGSAVVLDWNDCPVVHDELAAYHGGGGLITGFDAEVTGRMVFRPFRQVPHHRFWKQRNGTVAADEALIPVVLVESLHIQVLPKTAHPERKRVFSTTLGAKANRPVGGE